MVFCCCCCCTDILSCTCTLTLLYSIVVTYNEIESFKCPPNKIKKKSGQYWWGPPNGSHQTDSHTILRPHQPPTGLHLASGPTCPNRTLQSSFINLSPLTFSDQVIISINTRRKTKIRTILYLGNFGKSCYIFSNKKQK